MYASATGSIALRVPRRWCTTPNACWRIGCGAGATMSSPQLVKDYLSLQLAAMEHEVFVVVLLDAQHRLIAVREMFRGTVTQTSVYPREVVKEALLANAAAVILAHNQSPRACPSRAGQTSSSPQSLKSALALVDVRGAGPCGRCR